MGHYQQLDPGRWHDLRAGVESAGDRRDRWRSWPGRRAVRLAAVSESAEKRAGKRSTGNHTVKRERITEGNEYERAAEKGIDGIEKLKTNNYDLVFIDFNLPDMGGDAVLSKIKESGSNYGKSVLMSGDENLNAEFENKGFNYFLHKPIKKSQFKEFLGKL